MEEANTCEIDRLPEGCIAHVLSFTSPFYTCCAATMSRKFRTAADSNTVWGKFLPSDYLQILTRAVEPVIFDSLRELYFRLCDQPVLIDDGTKLFSLKRESGAKCFTVSAKELSIVWGNDKRYWRWVAHPNSRFSEVAELRAVCWLDVSGGISSRELTPFTTYGAYLIFKISREAYGLSLKAQEVSVGVGTQISRGGVYVDPPHGDGNRNRDQEQDVIPPEVQVPQVRSDGWMEVLLGQFYSDDGNEGDVTITFKHLNPYWSGGLIIQAVQFRPL